MAHQPAEVAEYEQINHVKITDINAQAKIECSVKREKIHYQSKLELKKAHFQHQSQEAAVIQAHELMMMDKQIALKCAKAGGPFIDPNL